MSDTEREAIAFDIDHTVLLTSLFHKQLAHALTRLVPGLRYQTFLDEIPRYDTNFQGYRLGDHLAAYGKSLDLIRLRLLASLEAERLIYDDAYWAIVKALSRPQTDVWLITTGDRVTQQFKVDLIKRILTHQHVARAMSIRSKIISAGATKGNWLVRQWAHGLKIEEVKYDRITLVEDNPIHFRSINDTPGFTGYQILRPHAGRESRYPRTDKPFIHLISHLEQAVAS